MCFVYYEQTHISSSHARYETFARKALGSEVEQFEFSLAQAFVGVVCFGARHSCAKICGRNAAFAQIVDLVFHQGNQWRYDHCKAVERHGRHLECERFAAAGRQQAYCIFAVEHSLRYFELEWAEIIIAPVAAQNVVKVRLAIAVVGLKGGKGFVEVVFVGKIVIAVRLHEGQFEVGAYLFYKQLDA